MHQNLERYFFAIEYFYDYFQLIRDAPFHQDTSIIFHVLLSLHPGNMCILVRVIKQSRNGTSTLAIVFKQSKDTMIGFVELSSTMKEISLLLAPLTKYFSSPFFDLLFFFVSFTNRMIQIDNKNVECQ